MAAREAVAALAGNHLRDLLGPLLGVKQEALSIATRRGGLSVARRAVGVEGPDCATMALMSSSAVHHPVFARLWSLMSRHEPAAIRRHRDELLAGLSGRVIEVGAGAGSNFAHYPATVAEVVAVEPEPYLREQARAVAARTAVRIDVVDGLADRLPVEDSSFDAAVACLVLCTVPDQARALAELRRVLRPGGELRFYEHVLSDRPAVALSQRAVDRVFWPRAFGGCHTARNTPAAIAVAGFDVLDQRRMWVNPVPIAFPVASHAIGRAVLADADRGESAQLKR